MKPEDLITNNTLSDIVVGMEIVATPIALIAVNMARVAERNKAIEAYRKVCNFNVLGCCACKNYEGECNCEELKKIIAELN